MIQGSRAKDTKSENTITQNERNNRRESSLWTKLNIFYSWKAFVEKLSWGGGANLCFLLSSLSLHCSAPERKSLLLASRGGGAGFGGGDNSISLRVSYSFVSLRFVSSSFLLLLFICPAKPLRESRPKSNQPSILTSCFLPLRPITIAFYPLPYSTIKTPEKVCFTFCFPLHHFLKRDWKSP